VELRLGTPPRGCAIDMVVVVVVVVVVYMVCLGVTATG
jgi:hypothetical protein